MKLNRKIIVFCIIGLLAIFSAASCAKSGEAADAKVQDNNVEKTVKLRLSSNVTKKELDEDKTAMAKGLNAWSYNFV